MNDVISAELAKKRRLEVFEQVWLQPCRLAADRPTRHLSGPGIRSTPA
jgi:hypothetical protein